MSGDESLLDVFVNVEPRGVPETEKAFEDLIAKVKSTFGSAGVQVKVAPVDTKPLKNLSGEMEKVRTAVEKPVKIRIDQDELRKGNRGLNSFTNNAYQLGQAFEDFAVGFQLDGLRGGIRGATNNVTFLINNLTQAKVAAGALTTQMAIFASLGTAAAAVIGITVLPKLIEWAEAMDDIELRSKNVAQELEDGFRDAKFQVSLEIDARANSRAVRDAESSLDAIREIIKQAEDNEDLKFKIGATINRLAEADAVRNMEKIADDLSDVLAERLEKVSRPILVGELEEIGIDVVLIDPDEEEIKKVERLQSAMETFRIASEQAFDNAREGLDIDGELLTARDSLRLLTDGFEELKESRVLGAEDADKFLKALEAAKAIFGELTNEAQKLEESQAANLKSAREEIEAFSKLSAEHEFMNEVNQGRLDKEDKILFDMRQQTIELEEQAKKYREITGNDPGIETALAARAAALQEEQRVVLVSEINDLEKEIAEERKDANKEAETAAKRRVALQERLNEEQIKGQKKVSDAVEALDEERAKQASTDRQKAIQEQIDALQKLDRESQKSSLGDTGTIAFGDSGKSEIERLQEELKTIRESEAENQRQQRIADLEERIKSEREEAAKRTADLREDIADARQAEIDALNENADTINDLIEQLRQLQGALANVQGGRNALDPGLPAINIQVDPSTLEQLRESQRQMEDILNIQASQEAAAVSREASLVADEGLLQELQEAQAQMDEISDKMADGVTSFKEFQQLEDEFLEQSKRRDELQGQVDAFMSPQDITSIGRAQEEANLAAMDNVDFKSTSLETLTAQTNKLLATLNEGVLKLDTTARLG